MHNGWQHWHAGESTQNKWCAQLKIFYLFRAAKDEYNLVCLEAIYLEHIICYQLRFHRPSITDKFQHFVHMSCQQQ